MAEKGFTYIPPYDDEDVIAGQGTVAMEILRQRSGRIDAIFVPIGGGGFAAGAGKKARSGFPLHGPVACSQNLGWPWVLGALKSPLRALCHPMDQSSQGKWPLGSSWGVSAA